MSQMKDCVDKYNQLVARADAAGLNGYRLVNRFESAAAGERRINKLIDAIKAAEAPKAEESPAPPAAEAPAPDAPAAEAKAAVTKAKAASDPKVISQPADPERFKPARAGTSREVVVRSSGKKIEDVARAIGKDRKTVLTHLFCLHRDCGVGYRVEGEVVTVIFPEGKTADDAIRAKKE